MMSKAARTQRVCLRVRATRVAGRQRRHRADETVRLRAVGGEEGGSACHRRRVALVQRPIAALRQAFGTRLDKQQSDMLMQTQALWRCRPHALTLSVQRTPPQTCAIGKICMQGSCQTGQAPQCGNPPCRRVCGERASPTAICACQAQEGEGGGEREWDAATCGGLRTTRAE